MSLVIQWIYSKSISIAIRLLRAETPEQRAAVDLDTHYTEMYLEEYMGESTRRKILHQQYATAISATGMQSSYGFEGQVKACWNHKLSSKEIESMRSAGFHVSVIHGRYDVIAQLYYARKLAEKLYPSSKMVELHGGHLVSHERPKEVNQALIELIAASESNIALDRWTNLFMHAGDKANETSAPCSRRSGLTNRITYVFDMIMWGIISIFGLIIMFMSQISRVMKSFAPVRVDASRS